MKEKEFKNCLFQWRIPKTLRYLIMKEMEKIGLLKVKKGIVYMNDYYFNENKLNVKIDFKDEDTKKKSPYIPKNLL